MVSRDGKGGEIGMGVNDDRGGGDKIGWDQKGEEGECYKEGVDLNYFD